MKTALSIIDSLSEWSGKIFSFLVVVATFLITVEVIMRYAFKAPTIWSLEFTIFLCGITYVMGGAYAHLYDAHVKVDVFYMRWTPRVRAIADLVTAPFFFLGVGLLLWVGVDWTTAAIVRGETSGSMWSPLIWPVRVFIPIGSFLLLLQGLAKFIRDFGKSRVGREAA